MGKILFSSAQVFLCPVIGQGPSSSPWCSVLAQGQPGHQPATPGWLTEQQQMEPRKQAWHGDTQPRCRERARPLLLCWCAASRRGFRQGWGVQTVPESTLLAPSTSHLTQVEGRPAQPNNFPNTPTRALKNVHIQNPEGTEKD